MSPGQSASRTNESSLYSREKQLFQLVTNTYRKCYVQTSPRVSLQQYKTSRTLNSFKVTITLTLCDAYTFMDEWSPFSGTMGILHNLATDNSNKHILFCENIITYSRSTL